MTLPARLGTARLRLQIDIGRADAVWPLPTRQVYPALLDFPAPEVLVYPREAVVAEKLEAIVVLGDRNSRIKDHFDLDHLAGRFGRPAGGRACPRCSAATAHPRPAADRARALPAAGGRARRRCRVAPRRRPRGASVSTSAGTRAPMVALLREGGYTDPCIIPP